MTPPYRLFSTATSAANADRGLKGIWWHRSRGFLLGDPLDLPKGQRRGWVELSDRQLWKIAGASRD